MINLRKILNPYGPVDNNIRLMRWQWAYRDHFGAFPNQRQYQRTQCRICHRPLWESKADPTLPLDKTCSPKCSRILEDLRSEHHWN